MKLIDKLCTIANDNSIEYCKSYIEYNAVCDLTILLFQQHLLSEDFFIENEKELQKYCIFYNVSDMHDGIIFVDNADINVCGRTLCYAINNSIIRAYDDSNVQLYDCSCCYSHDEAWVRCFNNSTCYSWNLSTVINCFDEKVCVLYKNKKC